jgi:hypothetical protein
MARMKRGRARLHSGVGRIDHFSMQPSLFPRVSVTIRR